MNVVFADTSFFVALLLRTDTSHARAIQLATGFNGDLITSSWVISELASFFSPVPSRVAFLNLVESLKANSNATIVPPGKEYFDRGFALFKVRQDKSWSLVDCISFCIMEDGGIEDAWTADHHFEQAGFRALMT